MIYNFFSIVIQQFFFFLFWILRLKLFKCIKSWSLFFLIKEEKKKNFFHRKIFVIKKKKIPLLTVYQKWANSKTIVENSIFFFFL